jgi:hypothetical protein
MGRANARPMTGSATKQSSCFSFGDTAGLLRFARNDRINRYSVIPGREQSERTRNLEIPGSSLRDAPE